MVYIPNANWAAAKGARTQAPIYYIAIDGLTTKHFSTGPVKSAGTTKKHLMAVPDEIGQKVEPLQGKVSVRISRIDLIDVADEITDLISTDKVSPTLPTLINRQVTLYEGDVSLVESDYAPIAYGQVADVELLEDGVTYRLTLADVKRAQNENLFANADATGLQRFSDRLGSGASVGAKSIVIANVPSLVEGDRIFLGPSTHGSYTGGEEKVQVAGVLGTTVYLTTALTKSYLTGDAVRWATTIVQGNPLNLMYAFWTGDFANGSFPLDEAVGLPTGLGIPASLIDTTDLAKERDRCMPSAVWRFERQQPVNAARFLEQGMFRLLGYPRYTGAGKLTFRLYRPAWPDDAGAGLPSIGEGDIDRWSWSRPHKLHLNRIRLGLDFDIEANEAAAIVLNEDAAEQTATAELAELEQEDTGFRSNLEGQRLIDDAASGLLRRYMPPQPELTLIVGSHLKALEIGDVFRLTHSRIPNVKTGARGFAAARMEIIERTEHPDVAGGGNVELTVVDAGFARPAWIGSDGAQTDYDSASAAEKEFAYIGDDAGTTFGDGGLFYEVV